MLSSDSDRGWAQRIGKQLTGFAAERFAEFRAGVGLALIEGEWGPYDTYEWERFVADSTTGDFHVVMEFI